ncbi:hypothetical protein [Natronorubrum halophilum]|uniref:hypothetical protein n=1 Tax=Natronorubrum halophilum TaxID=1702106 RepID=UPI0010C1C58A|nr:hypothetical protein [Natronorubrum halophilum]
MTPQTPSRAPGRGRNRRPVRAELEAATARLERSESRLQEAIARLERTESRLVLLETTLHAVGRRTGVSIGSPCDYCERSHLLIADGMMRCPNCGYQQSI